MQRLKCPDCGADMKDWREFVKNHPELAVERTYFSASYKRIAGEAYGVSVGMMIYDRQQSINRTQYSMLLNAMYAAGPMIEVDVDKFSDPSQITFEPFSRINSNPTKENNGRGITQHSVPITFPQLFNFMTNEIRLADDECGLPSFLNGNAGLQGAGQTLGGLAMMTDNAVLGLEDCAFNIDEYFNRVHYCSTQPHFERNGCVLINPSERELNSAIEYQIGTCAPSLTPERNSLIIPYKGNYIPVVNGNPTDLVVEVEAVDWRDFSDKELGVDPCGFCVDKTWQKTGAERCNQHFVEQEEMSNCGNVRWTKTDKCCGYHASVPLPITLDEGDCSGGHFMGYLFHPNEERDPDATVEIRDCDGKLHGYAYPQAGDGHTLPIEECGNDTPIGYAVNNSATAPQPIMRC